MTRQTFTHRSRIAAPAEAVFRWHALPGAFERLTPPWVSVQQLEHTGGIENGARRVLRIKGGPLWTKWVLEHRDYVAGREFTDIQLSGPFRAWKHVHRMIPDGPDASILEDRIEYELPAGPLGNLLGRRFVARQLHDLFTFRHRVTIEGVAAAPATAAKLQRVVIAGASGMVGSALAPLLETSGVEVVRLDRHVRPTDDASHKSWNPAAGAIDASAFNGVTAVVNLSGENIAARRWSAQRKRQIRESRVQSTRLLAERLASLHPRPAVWINASAVGYYGDRGEELLDENSTAGAGFLAEVGQAWEAATTPARIAGIRVVFARFGMILSPHGGALQKMLPPFRLGLGGRVGDGRQYWSWITLEDAIGALRHMLLNNAIVGPVNVVAPQAVTNEEFTQTLARVLRRPARIPLPKFGARLALGEMADELLLASTRVKPARLLATNYAYHHPRLEGALQQLLTSQPAA